MVIFTLAMFMIFGIFIGNPTLSFTISWFIPVSFFIKWVATREKDTGIQSADIIGLILGLLFLFAVYANA